jgi:hypothetical protein
MADVAIILLVVLVYLVRQYVLYTFVLMMPILIVFWIPGLGPFSLVSRFMKKLAGFYVPFLFMTVPVAIVFRIGHILGTSVDTLNMGEIGMWISAIIIPFLALIFPLIMFWQAGSLFFIGSRVSHHMSAQRAKNRAIRTKSAVDRGRNGGRTLANRATTRIDTDYSVRDRASATASRARDAGESVKRTGSRLKDAFDEGSGSDGTGSTDAEEYSRNDNFDNLRDPRREKPEPGHDDDEDVYYIQ